MKFKFLVIFDSISPVVTKGLFIKMAGGFIIFLSSKSCKTVFTRRQSAYFEF